MNGPLLVAGPLYDRFRRGEDRIVAPGLELRRLRFECRSEPEGETRWPENERFVFPLFLPGPGVGPFREVLILLNGLNDSSYRKFFPWAASIARAGVPALIFPSAFLLNRRPREWITPTASDRAWQTRLQLAPDSATLINAPLSLRVARQPRALLNDALRTGRDLLQLTAAIRDGRLEADTGPALFEPGAVSHFLGYSLGGYLALALRLQDPRFGASKVIALCAGACTRSALGEGLDPVSPFILDRHATGLLLEELATLRQTAAQLGPLAATLVELFAGTSNTTRERVEALASDLTIIAGASDRVVPAAGIATNLGRIDAVLPLGIHEYPFNVSSYETPGVLREVARSHRIGPGFEGVFRNFLDLALGGFPELADNHRLRQAVP